MHSLLRILFCEFVKKNETHIHTRVHLYGTIQRQLCSKWSVNEKHFSYPEISKGQLEKGSLCVSVIERENSKDFHVQLTFTTTWQIQQNLPAQNSEHHIRTPKYVDLLILIWKTPLETPVVMELQHTLPFQQILTQSRNRDCHLKRFRGKWALPAAVWVRTSCSYGNCCRCGIVENKFPHSKRFHFDICFFVVVVVVIYKLISPSLHIFSLGCDSAFQFTISAGLVVVDA